MAPTATRAPARLKAGPTELAPLALLLPEDPEAAALPAVALAPLEEPLEVDMPEEPLAAALSLLEELEGTMLAMPLEMDEVVWQLEVDGVL